MRRLVHAFKYGGRRELLGPLAHRMAAEARIRAVTVGARSQVVVPVPAQAWSRRQRGYDQARLLAESLASQLDLGCEPAGLRRRRAGPSQARSVPQRRRRQVRAAFSARAECVSGADVVLVDDVVSTGATVDACARALLLAGAGAVDVVSLAT